MIYITSMEHLKNNKRKIGLEYEFLAIQLENGQAIRRDQIKAIWRDWSEQPHVELYIDPATTQPVGVWYTQKDGRKILINTDAGVCIVEFGFEPYETLAECEENMKEILADFFSVAKKHGVALMSYGVQPKTPHFFPDLKTEKIWYRGFARFDHFARGHAMFHTIAAHQPCIDVTYDELIPVLNTFNAMGGITIALFANSGWGESRAQCCHEEREHRWSRWVDIGDPNVRRIAGIPPQPFGSFRDYLTYNWSILLPAVHRDKTLHIIDPAPTIASYLYGGKTVAFDVSAVVPSEVSPVMTDVNNCNQYIWIQARPKFFFDETRPLGELLAAYDAGSDAVDEYAKQHLTKLYIETRNIACQPWNGIMAAPAFLLGLIENIEKAHAMIWQKPWEYWIALREKTICESLLVDEVIPLAEELIAIAEEGLKKRGLSEERYLDPLFERLKKRESSAMRARGIGEKEGTDALIEATKISLAPNYEKIY